MDRPPHGIRFGTIRFPYCYGSFVPQLLPYWIFGFLGTEFPDSTAVSILSLPHRWKEWEEYWRGIKSLLPLPDDRNDGTWKFRRIFMADCSWIARVIFFPLLSSLALQEFYSTSFDSTGYVKFLWERGRGRRRIDDSFNESTFYLPFVSFLVRFSERKSFWRLSRDTRRTRSKMELRRSSRSARKENEYDRDPAKLVTRAFFTKGDIFRERG